MSRTTVSGVIVVLLVITAGCLGGGSAPDATDTPTPAPTAEPTAAGESSSGGGGGGDSAGGGGADAATVVADRATILEEAGSYSALWRMESYEDGTKVGELTYVTRVDYENERYSFEMVTGGEGEARSSMETYFADGTAYQRYGEGDEAAVTSNEAEFDAVAQPQRTAFVSSSDALEEFTLAGTETFDGVAVTRYEMNEAASWVSAQQQADGEVTWNDFSYVVLVDDRGVVRSEHWEGTGVDDDGTEMRITFTYEVTGVGTTEISEPDWLGQASS